MLCVHFDLIETRMFSERKMEAHKLVEDVIKTEMEEEDAELKAQVSPLYQVGIAIDEMAACIGR